MLDFASIVEVRPTEFEKFVSSRYLWTYSIYLGGYGDEDPEAVNEVRGIEDSVVAAAEAAGVVVAGVDYQSDDGSPRLTLYCREPVTDEQADAIDDAVALAREAWEEQSS